MGHRAGSRRVGGGAFAWRRGGWRRGGACAQRVGVAGLVRCVEVARFSRGGLGSWWGLHAMAGLVCVPHWGGAWRGCRGAGWHRSQACTPCWDGIKAVSRRVLRTVTGWCQQTCGWRRGDIGQERNEKKKKKNISLLVCPRMRQWRRRDLRGLRGEVRWRGGGLRTRHVGKRGLCNGQKRNEKKKKKNITLLAYPRMQAVAAAAGVGAKGKRSRRPS